MTFEGAPATNPEDLERVKNTQEKGTNINEVGYDLKYAQTLGFMEGDVTRNWKSEKETQDGEHQEFLRASFHQLKRLSTKKGVEDVRQFNEEGDFADGLLILADRFVATKDSDPSPELFSREEIDEMRKQKELSREAFISTAQKLFPEVHAPATVVESEQILSDLLKTSEETNGLVAVRMNLEDIVSSLPDIQKTIKKIDVFISFAEGQIASLGNYFGEVESEKQELGTAEENKSEVIENIKLIYQLQLVRDRLQEFDTA